MAGRVSGPSPEFRTPLRSSRADYAGASRAVAAGRADGARLRAGNAVETGGLTGPGPAGELAGEAERRRLRAAAPAHGSRRGGGYDHAGAPLAVAAGPADGAPPDVGSAIGVYDLPCLRAVGEPAGGTPSRFHHGCVQGWRRRRGWCEEKSAASLPVVAGSSDLTGKRARNPGIVDGAAGARAAVELAGEALLRFGRRDAQKQNGGEQKRDDE